MIDDPPPCPTCGAASGFACTSKSGKVLFSYHATRHAATVAWAAERERIRDEATRPNGRPPIVMELRSFDGKLQRFYPGPKRPGWGARWR